MTESAILRAILLASSRVGARMFRNQVGRYWLADGRFMSSGLCVGSPDLVGWQTVTIGPEHVGQRVAVFVGLEVKTTIGRLRPEQRAFLAALEQAGGIAAVVRSEDDAVRALTPTSCDGNSTR